VGESLGFDHVRAAGTRRHDLGAEQPLIRTSRALLLTLFTLALASPLFAHEIGTTRVDVHFQRKHTYQIDVITAPQSLLNRLQAQAHERRSPQLDVRAQQAALASRAQAFASACEVRFGNVRVTPAVTILPIVASVDAASPSYVVVRLTGEIPKGAGAFTWRYSLAFSAYALALANEGHGQAVRQWLDGDQSSAPFPLARDILPPTRMEVIRQYLLLGFTHIVPYGLDHILFVLGVFLLTTKIKPILMQVTAFTIAHSITLGLTIYGLLSVSPRIVEPMIALSIAYVACENLVTTELKPWRVAIVFAFGLLHGMGFAGVLKELGLPRSEFLTALITFNVGVELGQLSVIATAFILIASWARRRPWYRQRVVIPASALIAATGVFWTIQRVLG
jgi:hydrogenase/urease accessory protein HupE